MVQIQELIERWSNVDRVLDAMTEHERQRHWDMSIWGQQTECGTVACAAGRCGLDPWFRERGFRLDFSEGGADISDVRPFFGSEGSARIFLNPNTRPVETVIYEVRAYTLELQKIAALMVGAKTPPVGELWPEQGGVYAGIRLGRDGAPDHFLILGPEHDDRLNWHDANAWAARVSVDNHKDFALPSRDEQSMLFDNVASLFQRDWYWSCEQHASYSYGAWGQDFADGHQDRWNKDRELRARAVRSSVIQ